MNREHLEYRTVRYLGTGALSRKQLAALFEKIVLTPEESVIIEASRVIDPTIERIAPQETLSRSPAQSSSRGGFVAKCTDSDQRVPLGSVGDGIWRMLGIALSLIRAKDGILLVDEIDTGLHYSVMSDIWRLVSKTAERLKVQVFATTHSSDCYQSLAAISRADVSSPSNVSIQRLEKGKPHAVAFNEQEIVIAAQRGIEVR